MPLIFLFRWFGVLLILTIPLLSFSQNCTKIISGVVLDEHDHKPMSDVYITISSQPKQLYFTNAKGEFVIKQICADTVELVFNHIGCESSVKKLILRKNSTHIDVGLEHHLEELEQFIVTGEKHREVMQQMETVSTRSVLANIGMSLGSQLSELQGVDKLITGATVAKPVIQGQHSNRLVLVNNGIRQEGQQWGQEHAPSINPADDASLTVLKGASSVRYGANAIGGVVLVETNPISDTASVQGVVASGYQTNGSVATVQGNMKHRLKRFKGLGYALGFGYKRGGNNHTPDYYLNNTGITEFAISSDVNYKREHIELNYRYAVMESDIAVFAGAHIGNLTDLLYAFEQGRPQGVDTFSYDINRPKQGIYHEINQVKGKIKTHGLGVFEFNASRQYNLRQEFDKIERGKGEEAELHLELTTWQSELLWHHPEWKNTHGFIGVNGLLQHNTYEGRDFIPNYERNNLGFFWIEHRSIKNWRLEAGLRFENEELNVYRVVNDNVLTPRFSYQQWSFNAGASHKINKHWKWHVRLANAWRPPHVSELFSKGVHHGAAAIENGNDGLQKEETLGLYGGLSFEKGKWKSELELFHNNSRNYMYLQANPEPELTIRGAFPSFTYQQTNAAISGFEWDNVYAWCDQQQTQFSLQYINGVNTTDNTGLIGIPPNKLFVKHTVTGEFKKNTKWEAWLKFEAIDKQRLVSDSQDFVPIPNGFQLVHFGGSITLRENHNFSCSISNVLNTRYRSYMNRLRYYSDEIGRNVNITYNFKF